MTHPLTDEICRQIAPFSELWSPTVECNDMRAAADWQLEQCITWLKRRDGTQYKILAGMMREAMRPTTQEDNQ